MDTQWPCVRHMADQHVYECVCVLMDQAGASFVSETVGLIQTIVQNGQLPSPQYSGPISPVACGLLPRHAVKASAGGGQSPVADRQNG